MSQAIKEKKNLALIDIDAFHELTKDAFAKFMSRLNHSPTLTKAATQRAYATAIDDMCQILDKVKSND